MGPASYFSFNNPNGMCPTCAGIGKVMDFDINNFIEQEVEDYWMSQGEAVYREMCEDDWLEQKGE